MLEGYRLISGPTYESPIFIYIIVGLMSLVAIGFLIWIVKESFAEKSKILGFVSFLVAIFVIGLCTILIHEVKVADKYYNITIIQTGDKKDKVKIDMSEILDVKVENNTITIRGLEQ